MKIFGLLLLVLMTAMPARAVELFDADEPVQDGLPVFEMSDTFAEIYQKLQVS